MLYISTRNKNEHYTANRALMEDRTADGGYFLPFRYEPFTAVQLEQMPNQSFGDTVAQVLNVFFHAGLSGWDVDCCVGKAPVKLEAMSRRVIIGELWHNPDGQFRYIRDALYRKLCNGKFSDHISGWADIVIRVSVLFGIYGMLCKSGINEFDVCVNIGDFSRPLAVWFAKKLGLPVTMIICASNENSASWDLIHRGELNTGLNTVHTNLPALDVGMPPYLEHLIHLVFGHDEAAKFLAAVNKKGIYSIRPDMQAVLNKDLFVSVVGKDRIGSLINSTYRSNQYILDPYTAVSLGSLQDYRAKVGESRPTVVLAEDTPARYLQAVISATGLNEKQILDHIH